MWDYLLSILKVCECVVTLSSSMNLKHCSSFISHCTVNWRVWYVTFCVQSFLIQLVAFLSWSTVLAILAKFLVILTKFLASLSIVGSSQPEGRFIACGLPFVGQQPFKMFCFGCWGKTLRISTTVITLWNWGIQLQRDFSLQQKIWWSGQRSLL